MNKFKLLSLILLLYTQGVCQPTSPSKQLHIGDYLPNIALKGFYKDASSKATTIADLYDGKLLLIDFWATWCSPCVKGLSELVLLKKEFSPHLEVLSVTYQNQRIIDTFMAKNPALQNLGFPMITGDSILSMELFPHRILPHIAWIDSMGKVVAITGSAEVTEENLANALAGKYPEKEKSDLMNFRPSIPFNEMNDSQLGRSIVTPRLKGGPSGVITEPYGIRLDDSLSGLLGFNCSLETLYRIAAFGFTSGTNNFSRLKFEVPDSTIIFNQARAPLSFSKKYKSETDWKEENLYCYELTLPYRTSPANFGKHMTEDLNRYFNLWGRFEKDTIDCWVISVKDEKIAQSLLASNFTHPEEKYANGVVSKMKNKGIERLFYFLNQYAYNDYFVDETGIDYNIDIDFAGVRDGLGPLELPGFLGKYGLMISKEKRLVDVYKVSER